MISVTVHAIDYGEEKVVGTISWNGRGYQLSDPQSAVLHNILGRRSIRGQGGKILTKDDPEEFLAALHLNYRSPYLSVTKVHKEESDG